MTNMISTEILAHRFQALEEAVAALAKIAAKVQAAAPEIIVLERFEKTHKDSETSVDITEAWLKVQILNAYPVIEGGWQFVAVIDHIAEAVNIVRVAPDFRELDLSHLQTADSKCDHCKVNRSRLRTYLFVDESDKFVQVGSTCMTDFTGHQVKFQWLEWIDEFSENDDIFGSYMGGARRYSVADLLGAAYRLIDSYGFHKADSAIPTKSQLVSVLMEASGSPASRRSFQDLKDLTGEGIEEIQAAVKWILEEEPDSDYIRNLKTVVQYDLSDSKYHGLIASLLPAYRREMGFIVIRAAREAEVKVPVVTGDKVQITGSIVSMDLKETQWGYRDVMTVLDDRGFKIWGTHPAKISAAKVGDKVSFIADIEASSEDVCFGFFKRPTKVMSESVE